MIQIPSPRSQKKARIEIIPLIDIIFFLLATFVMVSLSMIQNQGIGVNLPSAATSTPQERPSEYISLSVTEDGEYFYNKDPLPLEEIVERLRALLLSDPDPKIFINGDEEAEFGKAIALLDEVRRIGITRISIETRKK